ncbi:MAG: SURF1 family protein, partial [Candidatus Eisenbacteria bacterium]
MARAGRIGLALLALAAAALCARLGVWQGSRWRETRVREAARLAGLAAPAIVIGDTLAPLGRVRGRVVEARGVYDTTHRVILTGATHDGAPGVELVTPLETAGGAVLIERGWLAADDGVHAELAGLDPPETVTVRGLAEPLRRGAGDAPRPLDGGPPGTLAARWLDADSLAPRLPYAIADWALRELPSPAAPARPVRLGPPPLNPGMHLSYAIQWFVFA